MQVTPYPYRISIPSITLLWRNGWRDPVLITLLGGLAWLVHFVWLSDGYIRLKQQTGYPIPRILLLLFLATFLYGTVQGARKRLVVFINDEVTPGLSDALVTLGIVVGIPLLVLLLFCMAFLLTTFVAPANFEPSHYQGYAMIIGALAWGCGGLWLFARSYAYNRDAISASIAVLTKVTWCLIAITLFMMADDQDGECHTSFTRGLQQVFLLAVILLAMSSLVTALTYDGPSRNPKF